MKKKLLIGLIIQMIKKSLLPKHERTAWSCPLCAATYHNCHSCINHITFTGGICSYHKTYDDWIARLYYWCLMYDYVMQKPMAFFLSINNCDTIKELSKQLDSKAFAEYAADINYTSREIDTIFRDKAEQILNNYNNEQTN